MKKNTPAYSLPIPPKNGDLITAYFPRSSKLSHKKQYLVEGVYGYGKTVLIKNDNGEKLTYFIHSNFCNPEKYKSEIEIILLHYISVSGNYISFTDTIYKPIRGLLDAGISVNNIIKCIDYYNHILHKKSKLRNYFTPKTILQKTFFENYLQMKKTGK